MANRIKFSDSDRDILKKALNFLDLDQSELSGKIGITQSGLSQLLGGQTKSVGSEVFAKMIDSLVEKARLVEKDQKKAVDNQFYEIAGFLSRFSSSAKNLIPTKIFPSGEILPVNAKNYIERQFDKEILAEFQDMPFTLLVSGPAQTGKSSLLANLESTAKSKGIQTLWFDPKQEIPAGAEIKDQYELNKLLIKSFVAQLQREWKLPALASEEPLETVPDLLNWMKTALIPTKYTPRVLIIDDLGRLGMLAAEHWLRRFVREAHNERAKTGATGSMSIAIGISYGYHEGVNTASLLISSIVYWSKEIIVDWFNKDEVKELAKKMEIILPKGTNLYDLFGGHPYLTNVALNDKDFLDANIKWKNQMTEQNARPIRGAKPYKLLLNAARRAILGPSWDKPELNKNVLKNLFSRYKDPKFEAGKIYKQFLIDAKFLKSDNNSDNTSISKPTIDLYRLVIEDLIDEETAGEYNK